MQRAILPNLGPLMQLRLLATIDGASRYYFYGILLVIIFSALFFDTIIKTRFKYVFMYFFFMIILAKVLLNNQFFIDKNFIDYSSTYKYLVINNKYHNVAIPINPYPITMKLR